MSLNIDIDSLNHYLMEYNLNLDCYTDPVKYKRVARLFKTFELGMNENIKNAVDAELALICEPLSIKMNGLKEEIKTLTEQNKALIEQIDKLKLMIKCFNLSNIDNAQKLIDEVFGGKPL